MGWTGCHATAAIDHLYANFIKKENIVLTADILLVPLEDAELFQSSNIEETDCLVPGCSCDEVS